MKKIFYCLVLLLVFSLPSFARAKYQGYVEKGGKDVKTSTTVKYELMETYPTATITVYLAGTLTIADIFSDNFGTVRANPFTADTNAYFFFYADNGKYDIKFSGTGIVTPFTRADIILVDSSVGVFDVRDFGAKCDRVGETGTDDRVAIQAAITAAEAFSSLGKVLISGQCLVKKTSGTEILLVTKGITIEGVGGRSLAGIYASIDTPNTIDILRYKPTTHPFNEGFVIRGITIAAAGMIPNSGAFTFWTIPTPSARHVLVLDDTATTGTANINRVTLTGNFFGYTTAASGAGKGIVGTSTSIHGCPSQSLIEDNLIFNGVLLPGAGDTVTFRNNKMMGQNALDITQVTNATTLAIENNNITFSGGINIPVARTPRVEGNIIELAEADSVGSGSALLQLGSGVSSGSIDNNFFGCNLPSPNLLGIRLNTTDHVYVGLGNKFGLQAGSAAVFLTGVTTLNYLGDDQSWIVTADLDAGVARTVYAYKGDPVASFGNPGYIAQKGWIKAIGGSSLAPLFKVNNIDTGQISGFIFESNGTQKGHFLRLDSTFGTVGRRNNIELINLDALGSLGFFTNNVIGQGITVNPAGITSLFKSANVASAAAIVPTGNLFHVTGTTNITSITATGIVAGSEITIIFDDILTFTDGSNLKLAGNFVTTADDTIKLVFDGTNFYEVSRAVN